MHGRIPLAPIHGSYIPNSRQGHSFAFLDPDSAPFPVNLICVNADQLPAFLQDAGPEFSAGRYTIGFWWWEVTTFPQRSMGALDLVDEVWVGSEHVAEALRGVSSVPVIKVRIPVTMPPIVPYSRGQLGLPDGFVFFFMFDFHSVIERKNPMAVIEAFQSAFAPEQRRVARHQMHQPPEQARRLRPASPGREHPSRHPHHQSLRDSRREGRDAGSV